MSAVPFDETAAAPAADSPPIAAPTATELLHAVGGLAALGLCAGLGSGDLATAARSVPAGLLAGGGALLLTGPALVVAHQFLGLGGRPEVLVAALGRGFVTAGRVALGLAPAMLFASATSGLWGYGLVVLLMGAAVLGFANGARRLVAAEGGASAWNTLAMHGLVGTWIALTSLVGLRLGWDVARFVTGSN